MIDTQAIRSKILDLAMRGKLTEQLPEDGTAEGLVATSANPKTTRMLATPFEIPNSWRWTSVEKLTTPIGKKSDQIYANDVKNTGKYPAVSQGEQFIDGYTDEEKAIVDLPVIIFGDHTKNVKFVDFPFVICADGTKCLKVSSLNDPKFVFFWMKYASGAIEDRGYARHYSLLKKYPVSLPPLAEQHRIVARIEQAFAALDTIDALQAKYADNLAVLKSKLIDAAIRGKLTDQLPEDGTAEELYRQIQAEKQALVKAGKIKKEKPLPEISADEIPFEIPENWKWIRWGDIVNIVSARRVHQADWRKTGVPFYRAREIAKLSENGYVKNELFISEELYEEFSKSGVPHENDLMVSAVGTLGKTYVVQKDDRFYYKDASVLCFENFGNLNPYFLAFIMKSNVMRTQIESNSGGTTVDTLTMVRMVKYLIPLPPLAEQKRIVAKLEELLPLCERLKRAP